MHSEKCEKRPTGVYGPNIIIHGGAGAISRASLPPNLYLQYHDSLLKYIQETKSFLDHGASALEAACQAVLLMEDDPLFNCGRGSVFTKDGSIEMEASVMVTSAEGLEQPGSIKRGAAVSLVRHTRHPILLAKEVLLAPEANRGLGGTDTMHCHLSGKEVEEWGFNSRGLEQKPKEWFWTRRRWEEHRRGLRKPHFEDDQDMEGVMLPSQGTVGAVCVDVHGNLAVATSTGGLTNKAPGRIGDTPSLGAGFWAESWTEGGSHKSPSFGEEHGRAAADQFQAHLRGVLGHAFSCLPQTLGSILSPSNVQLPILVKPKDLDCSIRHRAVAMSGTGNGDSFLRTNAVRTASAFCRFSGLSLAQAVSRIAGPGGELQESAGPRWKQTGEGEGGIIGIEASNGSSRAVFDFNCGGMWRAWYEVDQPRVMVFRDEYQ
jgi:L-asparaginase